MMTDEKTKKCQFCGAEIPSYVERCEYCGVKQKSTVVPRMRPENYGKVEYQEDVRLRKPHAKTHWFVKVYLSLGIFANVIMTILYVIQLVTQTGLWSGTPDPLLIQVIELLLSLAIIGSYVLLFLQKKIGFYGAIAITAINVLLGFFALSMGGGSLLGCISPVIAYAVLYYILQIKKNGVSYFATLE